MIKRALVSVSDKNGIVDFCRALYDKGVEIISTGGTAKLLRDNGIDVVDVSTHTGHPEMMDGRVKTLHPKIHGGLLAVRDNNEHMESAKQYDIGMIDMVVVNLYPFEQTVHKEGVSLEEAIEQIDIGGPSMLRSAAKNFRFVTVVTDPSDYDTVANQVKESGETKEETRRMLAEKVFALTARYDSAIANYLTNGRIEHIISEKVSDLRYGENPHQKASLYRETLRQGSQASTSSLVGADKLQGKELSYNNIMDADAALETVREFERPAVVFVKHSNPCGAASAESLNEAFVHAYEGDSKSAFGGIIAMNRPCTAELAESIVGNFFEIVIAPSFDPAALETLAQKPNLRVLAVGEIKRETGGKMYRRVSGGLLIQETDTHELLEKDLKVVTRKTPTAEEMRDLLFAWRVAKHVKSNAIVLAKNGMTVGIGAGQMSRVDAVELAIKKSMNRQDGSVMASDAFFPFPDNIEEAAKAGITAIIQPGGSVKDEEVTAEADKHGIAMVFTGIRAFLH